MTELVDDETKERVRDVNQLFDAVIARKEELGEPRFKEYAIFRDAMGNTKEMHQALHEFLHDVTTCPGRVISYCQEFLAPRASE